jgi:transposase InsO family protein
MFVSRIGRQDLEAAIIQPRKELNSQRRENHNLRVENEILREAAEPLIHHAPARAPRPHPRPSWPVRRPTDVPHPGDRFRLHHPAQAAKPDQARRRRSSSSIESPQREFTTPTPGLKPTGDISCLPTGEGWIYLATVLDLCNKELIGYAIAPHMRASLVIDAITAAHKRIAELRHENQELRSALAHAHGQLRAIRLSAEIQSPSRGS